MPTESDIKISSNFTPKNALFCCHTPVCLNAPNSPKLLPVDYQFDQQFNVVPVSIPDLTKIDMDEVIYRNNSKNDTVQQQQRQQPVTTELSSSTSSSTPSLSTTKVAPAVPEHDVRHGVVLRRVTPPRRNTSIKKSDQPLMNVVLKKVDRTKLLAPPKPRGPERSPPPKKLATKKTQSTNSKTAATNTATTKKQDPSTNNNKNQPDIIVTPAPKPPPPVNLLKNRPPLEIHRIEGDKIIIIKRIPRSNNNRHGHHGAAGSATNQIVKSASDHGKHLPHNAHGKGHGKSHTAKTNNSQVIRLIFYFYFVFLIIV